MESELDIKGIRFHSKKESVPYHNRLTYKATVILLILLKCCRGKGCSIAKLQIIINYLHSEDSQNLLIEFIESRSTFVYLRYDPTVIKALGFMKSDGLIVVQKNGSFLLTNKGKKIAKNIWDDNNIFLVEKAFLKKIGGSLTEVLVKEISESVFNI